MFLLYVFLDILPVLFPEKEVTENEDEMVGWHHQLNGHEFQQAPGDGEGQGRKTDMVQPL